jgi:outer membrane protein OmpA-like peptidoglycan-associated protein
VAQFDYLSNGLAALAAAYLLSGVTPVLAETPAGDAGQQLPESIQATVTRVDDGVRVDGVAIPNFTDAVETLVLALDSGRAEIAIPRVSVLGVATDEEAWQQAVEAFVLQLPPPWTLDADVRIIAAGKPPALLCRELFVASTRQPIRFQQSGATIRSASYAALDRLVEFAADCPAAMITITGHSDSMGDPAFNLELSRQRAQSVADYLVERGVAAGQLTVVGAGATEPVADNATSYGRRQNRRIEFTLQAPADAE